VSLKQNFAIPESFRLAKS